MEIYRMILKIECNIYFLGLATDFVCVCVFLCTNINLIINNLYIIHRCVILFRDDIVLNINIKWSGWISIII